jgi:hypothetical protein
MGLLAPLFLLGLAALAVPIIVHLFQRERRDPIRFPSLMFLRQVPYKSVRKRRIRNWPLFLLRSLALVLLVLAFTRPFVERDLRAAGPLDDAREVVLLLDRSYSMGYGDRWNRAVAAAASVLTSLRAEDRATLVAFDGGATSLTEAGAEPVRIRAVLDSLKPGSGVTRFAPALKLAQGILAGSERPHSEVVLISDFQRSAWDGDPGARLPAGTRLVTMPVGDSVAANAAVAAVDFRRETVSGKERVTVAARIASRGTTGDMPVVLEVDGREVQRKSVTLQAAGAMGVEFAPVTLDTDGARGTVRITGDALAADNAFNFSLAAGNAIGVLIVDGRRPGSSLYLQRSLAIGEEPTFRVDALPASRLRAADLAGRSVVILNDAPFPAGEVGRRLRTLVERGGGLIVAAGDGAVSGWQQAADLLPGTPGETRDRGTAGGGIGYVDYSARVFELFRSPRSGDFAAARFFRYRSMGGTLQEGVLARFDDGAPALIEKRVGEGRVLVWASTLDTYWTDLPLQPVFLPFVHQLVRHAAGFAEPSPYFTVGDVVEIGRTGATARDAEPPADSAAQATRWVVMTPSGGRLSIDNGLVRLEQAGFYDVRPERPGEGEPFAVAANVDLSESELSSMDPAALVAAVAPPGGPETRLTQSGALSAEERERRQSIWWYLLIVAFALLAAETLWSNVPRRRAGRTPA